MTDSTDAGSSLNAEKRLSGGGEMGDLIRVRDWAETPLGPVEEWPPALASTLSICLSARFPMAIYWGDEGFLFYNDAWRPILGNKHPWALGRAAREVWPEIWQAIAPLLASVLQTGEATWRGDELLPMQRFGYTEECYFDYTFNPIRGQSGGVEGVLNVVLETTYRVLNDRRAQLLRELSARSGQAHGEAEACAAVISAMTTDPADIPFALLYLVEPEGRRARLVGATGLPDDSPARLREVDLGSQAAGETADEAPHSGWPLAAALRGGESLTVEDLTGRFGAMPGGFWPEPATQALVLPVVTAGAEGAAALLVAGVNPRHPLDDDYRHFFRLVAAHIATALTNARIYEEERKRAEALAEIDRAKTAFFSNVSHEFRTPLTLMLGPLEDTLAEDDLPPATHERLEVAHRNSQRLLRLVNTLLDFSRIEAGRIAADLQAMQRINEVGNRCALAGQDLAQCLAEIVAAAVAITDADKGNLQLLDADAGTLRIAAQQGFAAPFLEFFGCVSAGEAAVCGAALRSAGRIVVEDVTQSEIFAGQASLNVLLDAGVRAVQSTPLISSSGRVLGMISTHFAAPHQFAEREVRLLDLLARQAADFIERRRVEEALRESEALLSAVLRQLPVGLGVTDTSGRWIISNEVMDRLVPRAIPSTLPDRIKRWRAYDPDGNLIPPENWPGARALRGEVVVGLEMLHTADDERELWMRVSAAPLRNQSGEIVGTTCVVSNIDQAKRAQIALRESEERFRTMANTTPAIIWTAAPDGKITFHNRQWLEYTGLTPEQNEYDWMRLVLHPDDYEPCLQAWRNALERGESYEVEIRNRRRDGEYRWFLTRATPVRDAAGRITVWFGSTTDIHDRKQAEAEREQALEAERAAREAAETPHAPKTSSSPSSRTNCARP